MRSALILALLATPALAAPPSTCGAEDDYSRALCAYQRRDFATAENGFRAIVEKGVHDAEGLHAVYFLARTEMKRGRFAEASTLLIRIYTLDKSFYETWSCDFLLGECRRAQGKE